MKAIKTLVFGMALLLVAGLALLGYGLMTKTGKKPGAVADSDFGVVSVPVPAGSVVQHVGTVGELVVVRLTGSNPERIVVLDPASGKVAGQFVFSPEAPAAK
jgi:hypothetical protein